MGVEDTHNFPAPFVHNSGAALQNFQYLPLASCVTFHGKFDKKTWGEAEKMGGRGVELHVVGQNIDL